VLIGASGMVVLTGFGGLGSSADQTPVSGESM
jgi:hypothetical protein